MVDTNIPGPAGCLLNKKWKWWSGLRRSHCISCLSADPGLCWRSESSVGQYAPHELSFLHSDSCPPSHWPLSACHINDAWRTRGMERGDVHLSLMTAAVNSVLFSPSIQRCTLWFPLISNDLLSIVKVFDFNSNSNYILVKGLWFYILIIIYYIELNLS